ncbi:Sulfotransferase family protein [Nonomuraea maritima]|uniref:Sulfotransferase family protein n=1 Tax=Nonomuraea maritima TaxID=683260 RepID=A0A1G8UFS4_9ACTN|nr:Sulfotransferase family protein [Nonomuraea maritima]
MIYLGGLGRSGTTLLERLLGEIPGVVALGEVVHLWERGVLAAELCGCGRPFPACPFWRQVGERAFGGWTRGHAERVLTLRRQIDRTRRIARIHHPDLAEYAAAYRALYAAVGAPVVVDSSKHASLACCLVAAGGVDVRVVHVVRDPRAVAHSWSKLVPRPEDGRPMTRWGPARTALHWWAQNAALELLPGRGARVTRVRYEDLVARPGSTLEALARELELGEPDLSFVEGRSAWLGPSHTASGNPMRFHVGRVELRRDDAWRAEPRTARRLVDVLTWPLRARYGYAGQAA